MNLFARCTAFAVLLSAATPGHALPREQTKPFHIHGKALTPDGKPVAGATAMFLATNFSGGKPIASQTTRTDADGGFDFTAPADSPHYQVGLLYITSAEGVGLAMAGENSRIILQPRTSVRVRLVDEKGTPEPNTALHPQYFSWRHNNEDIFVYWDKTLSALWNVRTDAQGFATLNGLPQDYGVRLFVEDDRFADLGWRSEVKLAKSAKTGDAILHLQHAGAIKGLAVYGDTHRPAAGVFVDAMGIGDDDAQGVATTDKNGRYTIPRLKPGSYDVSLSFPPNEANEWTAVAHPAVAIAASKQTEGVNFTLIHGGVITGHVTDPVTGKPVANASVSVTGPAHPSTSRGSLSVQTDNNGMYKIHAPAGAQTVSVYTYGSNSYVEPQTIKIADGETKTLDWKIAPPKEVRAIHGVVVGPDGAPVAEAEVLLQDPFSGFPSKTTDEQGRFTFNPSLFGDDARLFARSGNLATLAGVAPPADDSSITLHLTANALSVFSGQINDQDGKPLPHAKVALVRWTKRNGGMDVDSVNTDDAGRYTFPATYTDVEYSVRAEAPGYASNYSTQIPAAAGKTLAMGSVALTKADSFIGGVIVDPKGKPVAGAKVTVSAISQGEAVTDKTGRFHISGAPRDKTFLQVEAPEERQASVQVTSGRDDNEITVKSRAEIEEESKRFVAALDADTTNHGDGSDAQTLLKTAESKAAGGGKSVLLVFHASWCGPCFMLHRFLEDPKIAPTLEKHFVIQDLDIWEHDDKKKWENPGGTDIYKQYGGPNSVPFYVVLDANGKKLGDSIHNGENMGMPTQAGDVQFFLDTLKQAQPTLTDSESATLKEGLKQHASL
ncbi:hypothetical protein CCAX7_004580 [Capsulimonas corticalis]|uniref:Uncharacterized protein n=1 Tax=Capsulimonas corticalis TaxID=2219043 RepID=A0A402D2T2_9BACT|nr:carboxypeptidase regulatory-like domain-containing protein [Capsulimonas corticalis]BDI28407.1 hypothetical protein CCAX7_004580 [Capsulimonas corticalis]